MKVELRLDSRPDGGKGRGRYLANCERCGRVREIIPSRPHATNLCIDCVSVLRVNPARLLRRGELLEPELLELAPYLEKLEEWSHPEGIEWVYPPTRAHKLDR